MIFINDKNHQDLKATNNPNYLNDIQTNLLFTMLKGTNNPSSIKMQKVVQTFFYSAVYEAFAKAKACACRQTEACQRQVAFL